MSIFFNPDYDKHEKVVYGYDEASGLKAIIAVHNTNNGPALGGCRMFPYASDDEALTDVLRLSRGMTYKSALAGLPLGGGKSVIIGNPKCDKTKDMFAAMGHFVNDVHGEYIVAQDSGIDVDDLKVMATETKFVTGINDCLDELGHLRNGDPSPSTAYGVYCGMEAAAKFKLGVSHLAGLRVAIQGLGHVGMNLAKRLYEAGAELTVADIQSSNTELASKGFGAKVVDVESILAEPVDIVAPCAMGGAINDKTIHTIKASIIAGAANNQLSRREHGDVLAEKSILYAPDYVINAGGIIDAHFMREGKSAKEMRSHIERIAGTLTQIFETAIKENMATHRVADQLAELRFKH